MSNFICEICGCPILEDEGGFYVTQCTHYPLDTSEDTSDHQREHNKELKDD